MSENATPEDGSIREDGAPAIGADEQTDGGPGSHNEGGTGGTKDDPASGGVPEAAEGDD
ncbi:hypothetical protein SAMN04489867_2470 [Pedococcus dokdonensis]|uniref:Uncharacterized protein n=1 Tax=Pedococcus dokdonensis TaxID=443156 RepID=A0A1H0SSF0_9MICO|nr:hypothetical protein [Pedococcus dokdonensis]SDP44156.1 hypothetical protein SAMN04489867_2470 [Pedococcus dokdonensis]